MMALSRDQVGLSSSTCIRFMWVTVSGPTRASKFYERHGFQAVGYSDGARNEEQCPDILYEWR